MPTPPRKNTDRRAAGAPADFAALAVNTSFLEGLSSHYASETEAVQIWFQAGAKIPGQQPDLDGTNCRNRSS
jgi:hypothetical protein